MEKKTIIQAVGKDIMEELIPKFLPNRQIDLSIDEKKTIYHASSFIADIIYEKQKCYEEGRANIEKMNSLISELKKLKKEGVDVEGFLKANGLYGSKSENAQITPNLEETGKEEDKIPNPMEFQDDQVQELMRIMGFIR